MKRAKGPMSATEFISEKERRIRDDPTYRAEVERAAAEQADRARQRSKAEEPVLRDLVSAGVSVGSLYDLYKVPEELPSAMPVLIEHLARDYPDSVYTAIGSALGNGVARPWWADLASLYLSTGKAEVRDRLAAALSQCAVKAHYEELLTFLADETLGESRIYFLRTVNRIGNRKSPGAGRAVVARFADDPVLGKEAGAILAGKGPND
ncbi:hypothetical protein M6D93_04385 [Jatrophihabitans telluris]|uniref:HEAT repeat domain-containing protein n=1 Tax=Jatrophihabitans telluris TaxID=2038343 RepID=A0ABY4R0K9_9ACTN|nr:hypothetical protein [Jatrophihabitans telluris]UQX89245.1 hypothetical protein M6D93_04385 [Jatrophihabitans telluris]